MIDKYKELNNELGTTKKTNELQNDTSRHINTMLAYGPYDLGVVKIESETSAEKRIKEDLNK